jgi:GNAT superfamily N-acetyltransferase
MTYHASVVLRTLHAGDLPDLMALKEAASWNQTEDDWLRCLRLEPDGCFGIEADGTVAASATVIRYGSDLAWIGMVLTRPEFRGRGFARRLMERAIEYAGSRTIRLDASDQGQPLYESMDFVPECPIERWRRNPGPSPARPAVLPRPAYDSAVDRAVFGADRSALLADLARLGSASFEGAYAFARPGAAAAFFGPCVSDSAGAAEVLFRWFVGQNADRPAVVDLFPHHTAATTIAAGLGFAPFRRLMRMVRRPAQPRMPDPRIYAIAGFEWG